MSDVRAQVGQEPPATVADRLRGARRRRFVGRRAELELLRSALAEPELPFSVLWVHGLGGVGKTTLLGAFAEIAAESGRTPVRLDLRGMEPSPPAFTAELERAAGADGGAAPAGDGGQGPLVDTLEEARGLGGWAREGGMR